MIVDVPVVDDISGAVVVIVDVPVVDDISGAGCDCGSLCCCRCYSRSCCGWCVICFWCIRKC